MPSCLP